MQCKTPRSRGSCRRYVLYVNKGYRRSGTPAGCKAPRNIAGLCHHHAWGKVNSWIQDDRYLAFDRDPAARQYAHRELLKHRLLEAQLHDIRECPAFNFPLGNERFREAIETALGRRVGARNLCRPSARNAAAQI